MCIYTQDKQKLLRSLQWHMEGKCKASDWWLCSLFSPCISTNQVHNLCMVLLLMNARKGEPKRSIWCYSMDRSILCRVMCSRKAERQEKNDLFSENKFWVVCAYFHMSLDAFYSSKIKQQLLFYGNACKPAVFIMFGSWLLQSCGCFLQSWHHLQCRIYSLAGEGRRTSPPSSMCRSRQSTLNRLIIIYTTLGLLRVFGFLNNYVFVWLCFDVFSQSQDFPV